jgi:hypothetical protein
VWLNLQEFASMCLEENVSEQNEQNLQEQELDWSVHCLNTPALRLAWDASK